MSAELTEGLQRRLRTPNDFAGEVEKALHRNRVRDCVATRKCNRRLGTVAATQRKSCRKGLKTPSSAKRVVQEVHVYTSTDAIPKYRISPLQAYISKRYTCVHADRGRCRHGRLAGVACTDQCHDRSAAQRTSHAHAHSTHRLQRMCAPHGHTRLMPVGAMAMESCSTT